MLKDKKDVLISLSEAGTPLPLGKPTQISLAVNSAT